MDIYSLGIVFLRLLLKEIPFTPHQILNFDADAESVVKTDVQERKLHNILIGMLKVDPDSRPNAHEVGVHFIYLQTLFS